MFDRRLVLGSALFGIGWGIGGFCPGPGIAGLSLGRIEPLLFVAFMLAGMILHNRVFLRRAGRRQPYGLMRTAGLSISGVPPRAFPE